MHYFIDGYNLLFRLLHGSEDLQSEREAIIYELNKKISLIKLDVAIVFDAAYQIGGGAVPIMMPLRFSLQGKGNQLMNTSSMKFKTLTLPVKKQSSPLTKN